MPYYRISRVDWPPIRYDPVKISYGINGFTCLAEKTQIATINQAPEHIGLMNQIPTKLILVCGKPASGKSTLAEKLSKSKRTIVIAEDDWLAALFSDEMSTISDYVRCSRKLKRVMGPHVTRLLNLGISVVLDFPANTLETRSWIWDVGQNANVTNELHFLDMPDSVCKARLRVRNKAGGHPFSVTEEQFDRLSSHFVPPGEHEGFKIIIHRSNR